MQILKSDKGRDRFVCFWCGRTATPWAANNEFGSATPSATTHDKDDSPLCDREFDDIPRD